MMLAMSFGEKDSEKHARNPCDVTNQNIIITCTSITDYHYCLKFYPLTK